MKNTEILLSLILFTLIQAAPIFSKEYGLEEVMDRAVESSHAMEIRNLGTLGLEEDRAKQKALYHPALTVNGSWVHISETPGVTLDLPDSMGGVQEMEIGSANQFDTTLELKYLLFDGFARRYSLELIENSLGTSLLMAEETERLIRSRILLASFSYRRVNLSIASLESSLERLDLNRRRIRSFYDLGFSSDLDLIEINNKMDELRLSLKELEDRRDEILRRLKIQSGLQDLTALSIPESYEKREPPPSPEEMARAIPATAAYRMKLRAEEGARIGKLLKRSALLPKVTLAGALHYGLPGADIAGDQWQLYYTMGAGISYSLWDGGASRADLRAADHEAARRAEERDKLFQDMMLEAETLRDRLTSLEERIVLAERIEERKKEAYGLVKRFWETGQRSLLEVLDAEQEWTEAELRSRSLIWQYLAEYHTLLYLLNTEHGRNK